MALSEVEVCVVLTSGSYEKAHSAVLWRVFHDLPDLWTGGPHLQWLLFDFIELLLFIYFFFLAFKKGTLLHSPEEMIKKQNSHIR